MTTRQKKQQGKQSKRSRGASSRKAKLKAHQTPAKWRELEERVDWAESQFSKVKERARAAELAKEAAETQMKRQSAEAAAEALGHMVAKQRHDQLLQWVKLNKPELLKLEKLVERNRTHAAAGLLAPIELTVKERRRPRQWQPN